MSWEKLKMQTPDLRAENFKKLAELFPDAVTETITGYDDNGKAIIKRAVDADVLRRAISAEVIDGEAKERYYFTWPDKQRTLALAMQPNNKTLRLVRDKSVGRDGTPGSIDTENIYIEGDNLDALKILQETYLGKIKMIYIDPPYNTGSDFIYNDKFLQDEDEFLLKSGQADEQGKRLVHNNKNNGRFHTDWLNMIYPRLKFAKELLSDDGVIFISIDDNEQANLKKICDEIFGEDNFVAQLIRVSSPIQSIAKFVSIMHDYTLVYCKDKSSNSGDWSVKKNYADEFERRADLLLKQGLSDDEIAAELRALTKYPRFFDFDHYNMCDKDGVFQLVSMGGVDKGNTSTVIYHPITKKACRMPQGGWRYKESVLLDMVKTGQIYYGSDETCVPRKKLYLKDYLQQIPRGVNFYDTQSDTRFLKNNNIPFDFPKPQNYISYLAGMIGLNSGDIILDFFSGSATTAHAVMKLNSEDGGRRKFILVQLPELTPENSEARKAGYETICDIGEERIKRAGKKIKEERPLDFENLDIGFRVFKVDSSNMQDVYYKPEDLTQGQLELLADNIKPSRTSEDLLIQAMLDMGVSLSSEIKETEINGKKIFNVNNNFLIACFDDDVSSEAVQAIAELKPDYAVFKDAGIANNSVMTNFDQIFNAYSPGTVRRIL